MRIKTADAADTERQNCAAILQPRGFFGSPVMERMKKIW